MSPVTDNVAYGEDVPIPIRPVGTMTFPEPTTLGLIFKLEPSYQIAASCPSPKKRSVPPSVPPAKPLPSPSSTTSL